MVYIVKLDRHDKLLTDHKSLLLHRIIQTSVVMDFMMFILVSPPPPPPSVPHVTCDSVMRLLWTH